MQPIVKNKELLRNTGGIWHQKHNMLQLNQLMLLAAHNHIRKKPGPLHTKTCSTSSLDPVHTNENSTFLSLNNLSGGAAGWNV